jgi:hypothetical protein
MTTSNMLSTLNRILTHPVPDDLWRLQMDLLAIGGEKAGKARAVAGEFYGCLRDLESKIASRQASRWGAVLETASVTSVGLQEMIADQNNPLKKLLASGVTAALAIGAAAKNAEAWEVESSSVYYGAAWYLCGELWAVSLANRPELSAEERQTSINQLLKPILDQQVPNSIKSVLVVRLFQVALAAWLAPLEAGAANADPAGAS